MEEIDIEEHNRKRLEELPVWIRKSAVLALQDVLSEGDVLAIREDHAKDPRTWWALSHHGWGTGIRNFLRHTVCLDNELPSGNWDDYYIQLVEIYCGIRKVV